MLWVDTAYRMKGCPESGQQAVTCDFAHEGGGEPGSRSMPTGTASQTNIISGLNLNPAAAPSFTRGPHRHSTFVVVLTGRQVARSRGGGCAWRPLSNFRSAWLAAKAFTLEPAEVAAAGSESSIAVTGGRRAYAGGPDRFRPRFGRPRKSPVRLSHRSGTARRSPVRPSSSRHAIGQGWFAAKASPRATTTQLQRWA